jgi:hypothetical protein
VRCVSRPATVEDVEEEGYLKANPDVARAGVSARAHFTNFGLHEGRIQFDNLHQVARLREEKLRRVKFRSRPTIQRQYGEAINFLTPKQIADFALPDAPPVSENSYSEFIVKVMEGNPDKLMLGYRGGAASCLLPKRRKYRNISLTVHRRGVRRRTPSI